MLTKTIAAVMVAGAFTTSVAAEDIPVFERDWQTSPEVHVTLDYAATLQLFNDLNFIPYGVEMGQPFSRIYTIETEFGDVVLLQTIYPNPLPDTFDVIEVPAGFYAEPQGLQIEEWGSGTIEILPMLLG